MRNNWNRALAIPLGRGQGEDIRRFTYLSTKWKQMNRYILLKKSFVDLLSKSSPCPLQRGIAEAKSSIEVELKLM